VNRKYHEWTEKDMVKLREYMSTMLHPTSLYGLPVLARIIGVSVNSARGAVVREMKRRRDIREE